MPSTQENTVVLVTREGDADRKLMTSLLEKAGFHVVLSENGAGVLNLCQAEEVDLVIIDMAIPGLETSELLDRIQTIDGRTRVLLLTSNEPDSHEPFLKSNVRGHLSRPFRRAQFLGSVLEAAKEPLARTA